MDANHSNRRTFVLGTAAAVAATQTSLLNVAHAAGSDTLRVGLVGCGGRGTGAADQAINADKGARLVAVADAFEDRLEACLSELKNSKIADRIDVPQDRRYVGFDAYKAVMDQVDVILLATPPHFRPLHMAYAVEKNLHMFIEKPISTDAVGVRKVLKLSEEAEKKGLSLVSGLCWRYSKPRRETMKRVLDGSTGHVVAVETVYNSNGVWEPPLTREKAKSEMEFQMRNWYYHTWLGGDHIVEQAIHALDTMGWAMGDKPPIECYGVGGRTSRVEERYGNIYDHFSIVYEYENDVRGYHQCRHWKGVDNRVKDYVHCSNGSVDVFGSRISGDAKWRYRGETNNMYQTEHDEFFASIRSGKPINNGKYMSYSTLLAIMGRMAAYTGEKVTWDMALNSKEDLSPAHYAWGDAPRHPIARPGVTKFV